MKKFFISASTERSGHHSVLFWLAHQHHTITQYKPIQPTGVNFLDYDNYQILFKDNVDCDNNLLCDNNIFPFDTNKDRLIIVASERNSMQNTRQYKFDDYLLVAQDSIKKHIIILRDFKNTIASFMKNGNGKVSNAYHRIVLWRTLATEILSHQYDFINYNLYNCDINYRQQICQNLGMHFTDVGLNYITPYGNGSSFSQQNTIQFDNTQLNKRYLQFKNNNIFQQYMQQHDDCIQLSQQIFGEV